MDALKVILEGDMTSFRYPHFAQGVHPTYEMPPPATLYGQLCSVLGYFIEPDALQFAIHFRYQTKFTDYEHLHFFGKKPKMNPFERELLYRPRLTLYLAVRRPHVIDLQSLASAYRSPRYAVTLGRSQDLMIITRVQPITLRPDKRAYYAGTLLALTDSAEIGGRSYAVNMPQYINEKREAFWNQYAILPDTPRPIVYPDDTFTMRDDFNIWIDPSEPHPDRADVYRGIIWHEWA
jgi:CRISPR-associated protein Cas5t